MLDDYQLELEIAILNFGLELNFAKLEFQKSLCN